MTHTAHRIRRWLGGTALAATLAATMALATVPAHAQTGSTAGTKAAVTSVQPLPTSVLLFPAVISAQNGAVAPVTPSVKLTQEIVTEAVRSYLAKGGVGVVVYSDRLPSVQRAISEGGALKREDAVKGPGDDPRLAKQLSDIVGASEFITVSVDNYEYDPKTRRATFNLSVFRNSSEGGSLASSAEKAVGEAPADVAGPRQEGSAVARAAEVVAQKSVVAVYPQSAVIFNPPPQEKKKKRKSKLAYIIPVAALGAFLLVPR